MGPTVALAGPDSRSLRADQTVMKSATRPPCAVRRGIGWVLAILIALAPHAAASCQDSRIEIRGPWGTAGFEVEIADTPQLRRRGLQHREHLPATHGMLFLFPHPAPASFWMKDTPIPLDMIFIDSAGQVLHVHNEAIPFDETPITHNGPVHAVLEINGGLAALYGIDTDSLIRHPRLNQDIALWPCKQ